VRLEVPPPNHALTCGGHVHLSKIADPLLERIDPQVEVRERFE
jgi:hypothetical protein